MDLVPCVQCRRHVGVGETTCPFCAAPAPLQRPQFVLAARVTRAAIFSAALVACGDKEPAKSAPAPTQHQTGSGSDDDLEKMLDVDQHVVDHGPAADAGSPDAAMIAAAADAGVPVDAGVDPRIAERKRRELQRKKELERQRELERQQIKVHVNNKPYGAPPARRRVV